MDFVGSILEILKCIGLLLCKYIEYHRKHEEYKQNLKRILEELKIECGVGKIRKNEVKYWLENVEMIIHDAENVEQTFKNGKCLSCIRQAKLVEKKIQQVQEYLQKGNSFNTFNTLVIDAPPDAGTILPMTPLVDETTVKKTMEEIWRHLMDNETKNIGIFGMGGVGKTTIVTHINNRLIEEKKFPHVIWVTVSQILDLIKVQNEIVNVLKQILSVIKYVERTKFVLILDDMWEAIRLEEVGIPEPTKENGYKLVITTRSLDVCRSMKCKTVEVKPLSENEALELFFEKAELDISKQCASLPLAIVTIASSLKEEEDICEWRNALSELTNKVRSIKVRDDEVFVRLKFSFNGLKDEKIQRCFLYCALYPEEYNIPKTELDGAHIMIKKLVNNCLLLESIDFRMRSYVKVHDVVRDMVLRYITSKSPLFMLKAGLNLKAIPSSQEWKENLDKCPILSSLFLQDNPLESIPKSFFSQMHGLMILNLLKTKIDSLPNSISELTSLTALLLKDYLGLTAINEVPTGMEMLTNLKSLDLYSMELHKIPAGIFAKLCRLQNLVVHWGLEIQRVAVEEAARLKNLDSVKAQFNNLQDFNCYVKSLSSHGGPNEYGLFLYPKDMEMHPSDWRLISFNVNKEVHINNCDICGREEKDSIILPKDVENLQNLTVLLNLSESTPHDQYSHLKGVRVRTCWKVKKLFSSKKLSELKNLESQKKFLLPKLKKLSLCNMPELKNICSSNKVMVCDSLQKIVIGECPRLKRLPLYLPVDEKGQPSPPPALQRIRISRE
ncbi:hypothetical protein ACOSQ4_021397 [Xanthoceras sorbifolium]